MFVQIALSGRAVHTHTVYTDWCVTYICACLHVYVYDECLHVFVPASFRIMLESSACLMKPSTIGKQTLLSC